MKRHLFFIHCLPFLPRITFFSGCFRQFFFLFGGQKNLWNLCSLVVLEVGCLYSNDCIGLAWANSGLVILDEWSSYRGGCLSWFDQIQKNGESDIVGQVMIKLEGSWFKSLQCFEWTYWSNPQTRFLLILEKLIKCSE